MDENAAKATPAANISNTNNGGSTVFDAEPVCVDDAEAVPEALLLGLIVCVGVADELTPVAEDFASDVVKLAICESLRSDA